MISTRLSILTSLVLLVAPVSVAWAQPSPPPSAVERAEGPDSERARSLYREGQVAYSRSDWQGSYTRLHEAWMLMHHPQIAGPLGMAEAKLARFRDAAEHLALFLREPPQTATPEQIAGARTELARVKTQVGVLHIQLQGPRDDTEVTLQLDGATLPSAEREEVFVDPGTHTVEAFTAGGHHAKKALDVKAGEETTAELVVESSRLFASSPDAIGERPTAPVRTTPRLPLLLTGAGLATTGMVLGAVFTVIADEKSSELKKLSDQLAAQAPNSASSATWKQFDAANTSENGFRNAETVAFGAGAALAYVTVLYALWPESRSSGKAAGSVRAVPVVGARNGGVVVVGEW